MFWNRSRGWIRFSKAHSLSLPLSLYSFLRVSLPDEPFFLFRLPLSVPSGAPLPPHLCAFPKEGAVHENEVGGQEGSGPPAEAGGPAAMRNAGMASHGGGVFIFYFRYFPTATRNESVILYSFIPSSPTVTWRFVYNSCPPTPAFLEFFARPDNTPASILPLSQPSICSNCLSVLPSGLSRRASSIFRC